MAKVGNFGYSLQIVAANGTGEATPATLSFTTHPQLQRFPTRLPWKGQETTYDLSWASVADASEYRILRISVGAEAEGIAEIAGDVTSFSTENGFSGDEYLYSAVARLPSAMTTT